MARLGAGVRPAHREVEGLGGESGVMGAEDAAGRGDDRVVDGAHPD
jgi:hypothetical protein